MSTDNILNSFVKGDSRFCFKKKKIKYPERNLIIFINLKYILNV